MERYSSSLIYPLHCLLMLEGYYFGSIHEINVFFICTLLSRNYARHVLICRSWGATSTFQHLWNQVPLWSRLEYLNNYWTDSYKILYKYSRSRDNESYWLWWYPDFSFTITSPWGWLFWLLVKYVDYLMDCHEIWYRQSRCPEDEF